jgi:hypothetical protein
MRRNLLLVVLVFSMVLFFSNLGAANDVTIAPPTPAALQIHPCIGGGTVELDISIVTTQNNTVAIVVPIAVTGTAGAVLDTVLTGGLLSANPPAFNTPSLVSILPFTQRIVNPYGIGGYGAIEPMLFVAVDFTVGIPTPTSGLFAKMFYTVTGPGTILIDSMTHSTGGPLGMNDPAGAVAVNWGGPYTFNVTRLAEQAPVITQPDTLKYFVGDPVAYNFSATDGGGSAIQGAFIASMTPAHVANPAIAPINPPPGVGPWTITWNTAAEAEGVYAIRVGVYDECETTYCTTYIKLTGVVGYIWIGNQLKDVNGGWADPCDLVKVPVYLRPKTNFGAFDLLIEFDPTILYFRGVEKGPGLPDGWEYFTYRQLPCPMCGCCKYKLQIFGIFDLKNKTTGQYIVASNDTLIIAYLNFQVACDQNLRGYDLNICFEFDDGICTENTFADPTGYFLYVSDNPAFWSYNDCDTQFHGTNTVLNLMNFVLFDPPGTPNKNSGRPCGGVLVRTTGEKVRGDINLNLIAYDPGDVVLFSSYFIKGTSVFTIDQPVQIANTDINADGYPLSLSDFVLMLRIMVGDAAKIPKPTPGSDLATIYMIGDKVSTNANLGAALFVFEGDVKVSTDLKNEQGVVNNQTRVLVYMNSNTGMTGQLLTAKGKLVSVEAVDNFSRPVKTTVVNRAIPTAYALNANYPNPFNPTTNISFALPIDSKVSLKIYNVAGQLVRTLVNETMVAGTHTVTWDGINSNGEKVASGIYFYKLNAGDYSKTMKMVIMK